MSEAEWKPPRSRPPAAGCLLVATPLLTDPHFAKTVVYLLEHDGGGTVGVVLNRPSHTPVGQVLPDWHDAVSAASAPAVVFSGGPVQPDGALCLGLMSAGVPGIREVVDGVSTVDLDGDVTVVAPAAERLRVFAGHSGWAPGQLEAEIEQAAWWVVPGSPADLFSEQPRPMWAAVLRRQPPPVCFYATFPDDPALN